MKKKTKNTPLVYPECQSTSIKEIYGGIEKHNFYNWISGWEGYWKTGHEVVVGIHHHIECAECGHSLNNQLKKFSKSNLNIKNPLG